MSPGHPSMGAYPPGLVPVVSQSRHPTLSSGLAAEQKGHQIGDPCPRGRRPWPCQRPARVPSCQRLSGRALPSFPSLPAQLCPGEAGCSGSLHSQGAGPGGWTREEPSRWCPGDSAGPGASVRPQGWQGAGDPGGNARLSSLVYCGGSSSTDYSRAQGASSGEKGCMGIFCDCTLGLASLAS